jgi:hypothetical protein
MVSSRMELESILNFVQYIGLPFNTLATGICVLLVRSECRYRVQVATVFLPNSPTLL